MRRAGVPTPKAAIFDGPSSAGKAADYITGSEGPWVVKADGLAAGKGVLVTSDRTEAIRWASACLSGEKFGASGSKILVEEHAEGKEASLMVVTDGKELAALPTARDHKRLYDFDEGPNTGGMGAYSPVPELDDAAVDAILEKVFEPVVDSLKKEGETYLGLLYAGLILTEEGPKVLEFNVRFGDPEAQAVLPRLEPGLSEIIEAALSGELARVRVRARHPACLAVVAASRGYPERPVTGVPIEGLEEASAIEGVSIFHAGTAFSEGRLVTSGGRVLAVSAVGADLDAARGVAYSALSHISFEGMQYRSDIGRPGP
jgi:phosphoribosylamine--glycine ligase